MLKKGIIITIILYSLLILILPPSPMMPPLKKVDSSLNIIVIKYEKTPREKTKIINNHSLSKF
jgi:hypothetical protein